jgi:ParB/RepB/Spo0J family partition protein
LAQIVENSRDMTKATKKAKAEEKDLKQMTAQATASKTAQILTPTGDVVDLPVGLIVADSKKNTRSHLVGIPELAKSIGAEGQRTAVEVMARADGKYDLIAGFRRFAAISWPKKEGGLEGDTIRAVVYKDQLTEGERLLANLMENLAREDLTSYDAAKAFAQLRDLFPEGHKEHMSGGKIANRIAKSQNYVNNLLRCWDNLPEAIKDRWKRENAPDWKEKSNGTKAICTTDNLNKLAKESLTDEERSEMWDDMQGKKPKKGTGAEGDGARTPNPALTKRAGKKHLEAALEAAEALKKKASADRGQDQKVEKLNGIIVALKFALGTNVNIPGVYTPPADDEGDGEE